MSFCDRVKNSLFEGGSIEEPNWYKPIRSLYYYGSQPKSNMKDVVDNEQITLEKLEIIGYIEIEEDEEDDDNNKMVHITSQGESALSKFRDRQLRYATINVTQIVSFLVGVTAGMISIIVKLNYNPVLLVGVFAFLLVLFYLAGASLIEKSLNPIYTAPDCPDESPQS